MRPGVWHQSGGILSLGEILVVNWDYVEADFLRFYSMDMRVEVDNASPRRLIALIRALPAESSLVRSGDLNRNEQESGGEGKNVIRSGAAFAQWMNTNAK